MYPLTAAVRFRSGRFGRQDYVEHSRLLKSLDLGIRTPRIYGILYNYWSFHSAVNYTTLLQIASLRAAIPGSCTADDWLTLLNRPNRF